MFGLDKIQIFFCKIDYIYLNPFIFIKIKVPILKHTINFIIDIIDNNTFIIRNNSQCRFLDVIVKS